MGGRKRILIIITVGNDDFYAMAIMACKDSLCNSDNLKKLKQKALNVAKEIVKLI